MTRLNAGAYFGFGGNKAPPESRSMPDAVAPASPSAAPRRAGPGLATPPRGEPTPPVVPVPNRPEPRRPVSQATAPRVTEPKTPVSKPRKPKVKPAKPPKPSVHPVFKERAKAARRAVAKRVLAWFSVVAILGLAAWLVWASPVLAVRQGDIAVSGVGATDQPNQVSAILKSVIGTPLARLDTGHLARRLEDLPMVKQATVRRDWPTGLKVGITLRIPAAVVKDGEKFVVLDPEGVIVQVAKEAPAGLPQVTVPLDKSTQRTLKSVLAVVTALPEDLAKLVDGVSAQTEDTVTLALQGGVTVVWGDAEDSGIKAGAVKVLLAQGLKYIDVTAAEFPVGK